MGMPLRSGAAITPVSTQGAGSAGGARAGDGASSAAAPRAWATARLSTARSAGGGGVGIAEVAPGERVAQNPTDTPTLAHNNSAHKRGHSRVPRWVPPGARSEDDAGKVDEGVEAAARLGMRPL